MGKRIFLAITLLLGALVLASPARAALLNLDVEVAGNTATAQIELLGIDNELILTFDDATNLTAQNLGISVRLVSPLDLSLLRRLPSLLTSLPAVLPLLITIEPPAGSTLALNNTVRVEFHTDLLPYTAGSPFRLYKASLGQGFRDITDEVAPGSVRTRGTTGGFSQFLVLLDLRNTSTVVAQKFTWLRNRAAALPVAERAAVLALIDTADDAVDDERFADAIAALDTLRAHVSARAGVQIPNTWTPANRNGNLAGDLLSGAATLKFSVGYLRDYGD
jgi:hypothetical protein